MQLNTCIDRISKYLFSKKGETDHPLIVNVNNGRDLDKITEHFYVDGIEFCDVSDFCKKDELPGFDTVLAKISGAKSNCFITGLSSLLLFKGADSTKRRLNEILNMSIPGSVVILTYQCEKLLEFTDPRLSRKFCLVDGECAPLPRLIFVKDRKFVPDNASEVVGIENSARAIETANKEEIYIVTRKEKKSYPNSAYTIDDLGDPFRAAVMKDPELAELRSEYGTEEQWEYLFSLISGGRTFRQICEEKFAGSGNLDLFISHYPSLSEEDRCLYFIALKLYGAKNNECLDNARKNAENRSRLARRIYRGILGKDHRDKDFAKLYKQRKQLLNDIGNPPDEVTNFCGRVLREEENAIYCLTDNTRQEKELILRLIEKYYQSADRREIVEILSLVYPDLAAYLGNFNLNIPLLDEYFPLYTQSKVINRILPRLRELVREQAVRRDYNRLLQPRATQLSKLDKDNSQMYFIDALGAEYLPYIYAKCREKGLVANAVIRYANLPTITVENKEFIAEAEGKGKSVIRIKDLDEIKHHGTNDFDYEKVKQPFYLINELEIIDKAIENIRIKLGRGDFGKAIIVSDHGASRMAVINESENMWEMKQKGVHSGRCCPEDDADVHSQFATRENGYWVLANYDRFKGGRKANVEVHGGATLEEIVVPIIEITKAIKDLEIEIIDKTITVSYRKKARIRLSSDTKLMNVSVRVDGKIYKAVPEEGNIYIVDMPDLKKAKKYSADIFVNNNLVKSGLTFTVQKESSQERDLL